MALSPLSVFCGKWSPQNSGTLRQAGRSGRDRALVARAGTGRRRGLRRWRPGPSPSPPVPQPRLRGWDQGPSKSHIDKTHDPRYPRLLPSASSEKPTSCPLLGLQAAQVPPPPGVPGKEGRGPAARPTPRRTSLASSGELGGADASLWGCLREDRRGNAGSESLQASGASLRPTSQG